MSLNLLGNSIMFHNSVSQSLGRQMPTRLHMSNLRPLIVDLRRVTSFWTSAIKNYLMSLFDLFLKLERLTVKVRLKHLNLSGQTYDKIRVHEGLLGVIR